MLILAHPRVRAPSVGPRMSSRMVWIFNTVMWMWQLRKTCVNCKKYSKVGRFEGTHHVPQWFKWQTVWNKMRCEISHIIDSRMSNKFITFSIWSIDMQLHTLKFAPFQELSNHVWHYRGINMRNLTKRLICLEKQAFLGKKWSSENRKAHFEVEFPPHNPTFPLNGWHYRITLVLSFPMALAI